MLKRLEDRGRIELREEREGNLPPRAVYSVTSTGAEALPGLVSACAAGPWDSQVPLASLLVHLDVLDADAQRAVVEELVDARRQALASLERFRGRHGLAGLDFEPMERQARLDLEVLGEAESPALVAASLEASRSPAARAHALAEAAEAVLSGTDGDEEGRRLRIEGVLRDMDAAFDPDDPSHGLQEVRERLVRALA